MDFKEIFQSRGRSLPTHPVDVRIVDPTDRSRIADAPAVFRFVSDRDRLDAVDAAAETLAKLKLPPTQERREAEEAYHFLFRALRDPVAPARPFFATALEAQTHLSSEEAIRLRNEYERFTATHAPRFYTPEQIAEVRKDAETFSVAALLKQHGYWKVLRQLPSMAVEAGASLIPTS